MAMAKEQAIKEFKEYLKNKKRLRESQIESEELKGAIEYISEAMADGIVTIEEDGTLIQKLVFETVEKKNLVFIPTLKASDFAAADKYKTNEDSKRTACIIARATGELEAIINKLENPDYNLAKIIVLFYSV